MKDGKLFGKINLIDLLVLIVAVAAIVAVGLKLTGRLGPAVTETGTDITYTVKVEKVTPQVFEEIENYIRSAKEAGDPGDRLMASGELLSGYVTNATATPREENALMKTDKGDLTILMGEGELLDVTFEIQAHVDNNVKTELGTQEVRVGKVHIVKTTHFELINGVIQTCTWAGGTGAGY